MEKYIPDSNLIEQIEQKLNSVTHGIGAGLSIGGLIALLVLASRTGNSLAVTSFAIYASFQIVLYLASALTHVFYDMPKVFTVLRILDQAAIYLLIAGTYTPVALIVLGGKLGWLIFGIEWALAITGILMKSFFIRGKFPITDLLYLPMGWLIIFIIGPVNDAAPQGFIKWLFIGGGLYSVGIIFYMIKKIPLGHVVWHLFVIAGGISFFMGFILYLV